MIICTLLVSYIHELAWYLHPSQSPFPALGTIPVSGSPVQKRPEQLFVQTQCSARCLTTRQGVCVWGLPCLTNCLPLFSSHRHLTSSAPDDSADKWTGANLCCSSGRCASEPAGNQTCASAQYCGVDLWGGWGGQQVGEQGSQPHWFAFEQCCGTRGHSWNCSEKHFFRAQQQIDSACYQPQQKSADTASMEILLPPAGSTVCESKAWQLILRYPQPLLRWELVDEWTVLSPRPSPDSIWRTS